MAFDGTLKFDTAIDKAGFHAGLSGLGDIAKAGMAAVTGAVTAASGAVLALGKNAVSVGSSFESGMAQVIATMGITKDTVQDGVNSFDLLSRAAQDAGANTTFSATEAAGALNYLALAGYDAATAADSLDAVLNLAAAGDLDLAYAADLATDAMAALGIEASKDNLTHFGDQMAVTASKSNTSVAQLGEAILTVGGTAKSLSGGVAEMNAALGVLANRGIKGAEGGTALRNMILSLTAPTDKAAAKLDELGVKVLDDAGNMHSLNDVFRDLDKALSTVSDGEKTQILNEIFNKVDLKSAQAMLAGCGEEFTSLTSAISSCDGAMQQMADTMNDTLEGDIKSLQSKAEALGITVYQSLNDPFRELAQLGGNYLGELKAAFDAGGFEGAAEAVGGILGDAVTVLGGYLPDIAGIGNKIVSSLLTGISENSGTIIQTGIDMGLTMLSGFGDITVRFLELGGNLLISLAEGIDGKKLRIRRILREVLRETLEAIDEHLPEMLTAGGEIVETLGGALLDNLDLLLGIGAGIVGAIVQALTEPDTLAGMSSAAVQLLTTLGTALLSGIPLLLSAGVQILGALVDSLSDPDALNGLLDAGLTILTALAEILTENLSPLLGAVIAIIGALGSWLGEHALDLVQAGLAIVQALLDAVIENLPLLLGIGAGIVGAIVQALTEPGTLAGMSSAAVQLLTTLGTALLSGIPLLLSAGVQILGALVDSLSDPDALNGLLDAGLTILTALAEILTENLSPLLGAVIAIIGALGSWLGEHALDLVQAGLAIVQALLDAVIENLPLLLDAAVQIIEALCKGIEEDSDDVLIAIEQILRTLLDFLLSPGTLQMLGNAGGRIIRALIPAAKELAGDLLGFAYDFFSEFGTALFTPDWDELGKNIVYGILSGILGVDFDAELFKSDFAENWVSGFKDIFGIHSPSKLMEDEIGRNLALGIEVGFSENIPDIGGEVETALTELPDVPVLTVGVDVQEPEPVPVSFTGDAPEPDTPDDITIPVDYDLPEFPDPDPITVSLTDDAARILEELRAAQIPVTPNIDPAALEALRMTPMPDASALVPQSATSVVNNSYYNSYQSSTTMSSTTTNQTTGGTAPSGDIIIPVQIGGEQLETIVITAAQLANARSGGATI